MASIPIGPQSPLHAGERKQRSTSHSRSRSPSSPHGTVTDGSESLEDEKEEEKNVEDEREVLQAGGNGEASSPIESSPRFLSDPTDGVSADYSATGTTRPSSNIVYSLPTCSPLPPPGRRDGMGQQQAAREAGVSEATASVEATVRLVSPGRSEIIPKVSIQTGGTVRWVHGGGASTIAGAKEAVAGGAAVDQGEKVELVSTRKKDDGVGRCICGGEGNRVKEEGMTVLIISDVLDEPMTRQIPLGGSYADLMFDRPGSYAYYVYSGPVTKGHVVVEETHTADAATTRAGDCMTAACPNEPSAAAVREGETVDVMSEHTGSVEEMAESNILPALAVATAPENRVAPFPFPLPSPLSTPEVASPVQEGPTSTKGTPVQQRGLRKAHLKLVEALSHSCETSTMNAAQTKEMLSESESPQARSPSGGGCSSPAVELAGGGAPSPALLLPTVAVDKESCLSGRPSREQEKKTIVDGAAAPHDRSEEIDDDEGRSCEDSTLTPSDSETRAPENDGCGEPSEADVFNEDGEGRTAVATAARPGSEAMEDDCTMEGADKQEACQDDSATVDLDSDGDFQSGPFSLQISHGSTSSFERDDHHDHDDHHGEEVVFDITGATTVEETIQDLAPQLSKTKGAISFSADGAKNDERESEAETRSESVIAKVDSLPPSPLRQRSSCDPESEARLLDGPSEEGTPLVGVKERAECGTGPQGFTSDQPDEDVVSPPEGANVGGDPVLQQAPKLERTEKTIPGDDSGNVLLPSSPSLTLPMLRSEHSSTLLGQEGSGGNGASMDGGDLPSSFDSDDVPSGSWLGVDGGINATAPAKAAVVSPKESLKQSPRYLMNTRGQSSSSIPLTLTIVGVMDSGDEAPLSSQLSEISSSSPTVAPTATAAAQPCISSSNRLGSQRQRVEVLQRDGSGQEWQEVSPLTSPAAQGSGADNIGSFPCAEDEAALPKISVSADGDGDVCKAEQTRAVSLAVEAAVENAAERVQATVAMVVEECSEVLARVKHSVAHIDDISGGTAHAAGDTISHHSEAVTSAKSPKSSFTSCPSGAAAAAATAAGLAAAAGAAGCNDMPAVLARHEGSRESGGTAPASPAEEDPRCRAWSSEGDTCVDSDGAANRNSTPNDGALLCSSVVKTLHQKQSPAPPDSEGVPSSSGLKTIAGSDAAVDARVTIMEDETGAGVSLFEPEILTAPIGTRVRWERRIRRGKDSDDVIQPETFKGRVSTMSGNGDNSKSDCKVAFSFSLSAEQPSFVYTFSREGRYEIANEVGDATLDGVPASARGVVCIERVAGASDSDSFASGDEDGSGSGSGNRTSTSIDDDANEGHDDECSKDSDSPAPPSPIPNLVSTQQRDCIVGDDVLSSDGGGSGSGREQLFDGDDVVSSVPPLLPRTAGSSGGVVYSSSGVSTHDSIVSAPPPPPSVAGVSSTATTVSRYAVACAGTGSAHTPVLQRHRSLPPISTLLGSEELVSDDGDSGGRTELCGRSGWLLQADRLKLLNTRRPVMDNCYTAEATTASLSHVTVLDDVRMSGGRASPSRSLSGTDEYSASSLSDGQQRESRRPRDCGEDDDIDTDGSSTDEDLTIAVDRFIVDNDILSVCDDGTASSSGESPSCTARKEMKDGVQSGQSMPENTHSAAAAIVSSQLKSINPRLGDNGSDGLLSMRVGTKPASSLTVAVETAVSSKDGPGDTVAAVAPALSSPGGDSEHRDDFEVVSSTTAAAAGRKKKRKKKSKRKNKAAAGEQRENEGCTAREGRSGNRVGWSDCRRQLWGNRSALLLEERTYFKTMTRRMECDAMSGADGRVDNDEKDFAKVTKTLISRDDGFKPAKPITVEVEAIVAIKKSKLSKERYSYRPRTITLVGPVDGNHAASLLLLDETNNLEDVPYETTSLEAWPAGRDLEVIFFDPGEYYLVDHGADKRLKITAIGRATSPPPPIPPTESTSRGTDVGRPVTGEASGASSRSRKKKGKGKKAGGARTVVAEAAAVASTGWARKVSDASRSIEPCPSPSADTSSSDEGADSGEVGEKPRVNDDEGKEEEHTVISVGWSRGGEEGTKDGSRQEFVLEQPHPPPHSLPLMVASREGQRLSTSERREFEVAGAVGQVVVSHKKGFEPMVLHLGFAPGRGALVVCEFGHQECVTREVVCRHSSAMLLPREPSRRTRTEARAVGSVSPARVAAAPEDGDEDGQGAVVSARLGPGPLRFCHFILGHAGQYCLAYRDDTARESTVVFVQSTADPSRCDVSVRDDCEPARPKIRATSEGVGQADEESTVGGRSPEQKKLDESSQETVATVGVGSASDGSTDNRRRGGGCRAEKSAGGDRLGGVGSSSESSEAAGKDSSCNSPSPIVKPDAFLSTSRPPQQPASGATEISSAFTRGSTWCEKGFMGESGSWSGDGGGSFVQQRSHVKKSRRQQRSRAKKINGVDPETIKAAAAAADAEEEAAAIEAVQVHITEEERAAAALSATKASTAELLSPKGPTTTYGNVPTVTCDGDSPETTTWVVSGLAAVPNENKAVASTDNVVADAQSLVQTSNAGTKVAVTVNIKPATDPQAPSQLETATASPLQGLPPSMKNERTFHGQSATCRERAATKRVNAPKQHKKNNRHGGSWCSSSASNASSNQEIQTEPYAARGKVESTRGRGTRQHWKLTSTKMASAARGTRTSSWTASAPPEVKGASDASGWDVPAAGASWTEKPNTETTTTVDVPVDVLQERDSGKYWGASGSSAPAQLHRHQFSRQNAPAPSAAAEQGIPPVAVFPRWPLTPPLAPFPSPKDLPTLSGRGDSTDGELAAVSVAPTGDGQQPARSSRSVVEEGWDAVRDAGDPAADTNASPSVELSSAATGVLTAAGSDDDGLPRPHTHPARGRSTIDSSSSGARATWGKNNEQNETTQASAGGDREEVGSEAVAAEAAAPAGDDQREEQELVATDSMLAASSRSDDEAVQISFSFGDFASQAVEPVTSLTIESPPCQQQQGQTSPRSHPSENIPASRSKPASTCSTVAGEMASVVNDEDEIKHAGGESSNSPSVFPGNYRADDTSVEMQATDPDLQSSGGSDGDGGDGGGNGWDRPSVGTNAVPPWVEAECGWINNSSSPPTASAHGNDDGRNDSEVGFTASLSSPLTTTTTTTTVPTASSGTANDDTQHVVGAAAQPASSSDPAGTTPDPTMVSTSASHLGGTQSEGDSLRYPAVHQSSISTTTAAATAPLPPPPDNHNVPMTAVNPRWGNCSTTISGEERARRHQELDDNIRRRLNGSSSSRAKSRGSRGGSCHTLKPAEFPESSRLPAGGYWVAENKDDRLPPPSEFEIVEAARMMKLFDDMMRRLENDGADTMLPNGHTPAIYDLTKNSVDGAE